MTLFIKAVQLVQEGKEDQNWFLAKNDASLKTDVTKEQWLNYAHKVIKRWEQEKLAEASRYDVFTD